MAPPKNLVKRTSNSTEEVNDTCFLPLSSSSPFPSPLFLPTPTTVKKINVVISHHMVLQLVCGIWMSFISHSLQPHGLLYWKFFAPVFHFLLPGFELKPLAAAPLLCWMDGQFQFEGWVGCLWLVRGIAPRPWDFTPFIVVKVITVLFDLCHPIGREWHSIFVLTSFRTYIFSR